MTQTPVAKLLSDKTKSDDDGLKQLIFLEEEAGEYTVLTRTWKFVGMDFGRELATHHDVEYITGIGMRQGDTAVIHTIENAVALLHIFEEDFELGLKLWRDAPKMPRGN